MFSVSLGMNDMQVGDRLVASSLQHPAFGNDETWRGTRFRYFRHYVLLCEKEHKCELYYIIDDT